MSNQQNSQVRFTAVQTPEFGQLKEGKFNPWILWVTIRRCWMWALPIGSLLAGIAAILVIETFVPEYRAEHWLEAKQDYLVFQGVMPVAKNLSTTEKPIILNPIVLDPVLADPALRKAPSLSDPELAEVNLRTNLTITSGGTTERLVISYTDIDRDAAAMVANAITDSYLRTREAFDSRRVENLEKWLAPELTRWENSVEDRRKTVESLSQNLLGYSPGSRTSIAEDQQKMALISQLRGQITDLKVQLAVMDAQNKMEQEDTTPAPTPPAFKEPKITIERYEPTEADIRVATNQEPTVVEAQKKIDALKAMIFDLETKDLVRFDRPRYQDLQQQRDEAIAALEQVKTDARPSVLEAINKLADEDIERRQRLAEIDIARQKQQYEQDLAAQSMSRAQEETANRLAKQRERDAVASELAILEEQYEQERQRMEQFGGETAKLQFAQEELEVANSVLLKLRDRIAAIRTERQNGGTVRSLAAAQPPNSPIESMPYKKVLMAAGVAFLIPFAIGFLMEFRVQRITDSSTLDDLPIAPVMGEVARLPSKVRTRKTVRQFEESVDTLRANLLLSTKAKDTRSIAVVSSMSGEGKSSVTSQLALSIAKATGQTILLVDTDLRCPDQHEIFGVELGPGFTEVISGKISLQEAVNTSLGDLVHILPAGKLDRSPHRLMNPAAIEEFMQEALKHYAYVIFDTAPVLSAGETLAIASQVDATLMCVMRDVSRLDNLTRTSKRLEASGANLAGTVFNGITHRQYAYRYGNYQYALAAQVPNL